MITKKRIFALIFAIFILMSCLAVSIVQVFAWDQTVGDVTYSMSSYQYQGIDQGSLPYGYYSWAGFFGYYHDNTGNLYYYFELQNTTNGGLSFAPHAGFNNWDLAYSFDQPGFGVGDPVYRFYMPNNNGQGWHFQIRSQLGNIVFDSSNAVVYLDVSNPNRCYYEFTIDRTILGLSAGWYIYSEYLPYVPSVSPNEISVTFNYFDENSEFIGSKQLLLYASSSVVVVTVPELPGYINHDVNGSGSYDDFHGTFAFYSLTSNQIVNVTAYSFDFYLTLKDPATLTFRYYSFDESGNKIYFDQEVVMKVPSGISFSFPIPYPSDLLSGFIINPDYVTPTYSTNPLIANGRYYYDVVAMTLDDYKAEVIRVFKTSSDFTDIINQNRQEASQEGYDRGYEIGYNTGYAAAGGSGSIDNPLVFLTSPVVSFLNIELYPGLPLGIMFVAACAVGLIVIFLKIFAGG